MSHLPPPVPGTGVIPVTGTDLEEPPPIEAHPIDAEALRRVLMRIEADANRKGWDHVPAQLYLIADTSDEHTAFVMRRLAELNRRAARAIRVGPYTAAEFLPPGALHMGGFRGPWEPLRTLALNMAYARPGEISEQMEAACEADTGMRVSDGVRMLRHFLRVPGAVAVALLAEVWVRVVDPEEHAAEMQRRLAGDATFVSYADLPDSTEARMVKAIDLCDVSHTVTRHRGDKPQIVVDAEGPRTMIVPGGTSEEVTAHSDTYAAGEITTSLRILADYITGRTPPPEQDAFEQRYPSLHARWASGDEQAYRDGPPVPLL